MARQKNSHIYVCKCGFTMVAKVHMQRHLDKIRPCIKGIDMKLIDVETLKQKVDRSVEINNSGTTRTNLSNFTEEEISQRKNEQKKKAEIKRRPKRYNLGSRNEKQYAAYVRRNIFESTDKRNKKRIIKNLDLHEIPKWSVEDIHNLLITYKTYIIKDTILGDLEFPLILTNGYYNSSSVDRINDNFGYSENNIEIRPQFLNNLYKLTTEDIKYIIKNRTNEQEHENLDKNYKKLRSFFSETIHSIEINIKNKKSDRNITVDFESKDEFINFLINLYVEQGGRCSYSYVPIYPFTSHKYKISLERKDPRKSYNKDNITLITVGLNGRPCGQFLNKYITEEQREIALKNGKFNLEYWNKCTKLTEEEKNKCEFVKNSDKIYLISINGNIFSS